MSIEVDTLAFEIKINAEPEYHHRIQPFKADIHTAGCHLLPKLHCLPESTGAFVMHQQTTIPSTLYDPTAADRQSCLVHESPVKRTLKPKAPTMVNLLSLSTHLFHLLLRFLFILPILPLISSQKEF